MASPPRRELLSALLVRMRLGSLESNVDYKSEYFEVYIFQYYSYYNILYIYYIILYYNIFQDTKTGACYLTPSTHSFLR